MSSIPSDLAQSRNFAIDIDFLLTVAGEKDPISSSWYFLIKSGVILGRWDIRVVSLLVCYFVDWCFLAMPENVLYQKDSF